jgi:hypothetical protein
MESLKVQLLPLLPLGGWANSKAAPVHQVQVQIQAIALS